MLTGYILIVIISAFSGVVTTDNESKMNKPLIEVIEVSYQRELKVISTQDGIFLVEE